MNDQRPGTLHEAVGGIDVLRRLSRTFYRGVLDVSASPAGTDLGEPGPTPRWGWEGLK
ncbi:hypothetical protein ACFWP2_17360 [Kitasatospora sp. NPDC058444]|uniref:hypothetical protein n=1 Tax=Kitasatospora sp. NPDC058444 TaxID=3346504 RepID=UPI00365463B5